MNEVRGNNVEDDDCFFQMTFSPCMRPARDESRIVDARELIIPSEHKERVMKEFMDEKKYIDSIGTLDDRGIDFERKGVSMEFLINFTYTFNCWHWEFGEVVRKVILPATCETRCSLVEIPELSNSAHVGTPQVYVSYPYRSACKWGDIIATLQTSPRTFIYLDVLSERQWPGGVKWAPTDFNEIIDICSSFLLVCPVVREIQHIIWTEYSTGN